MKKALKVISITLVALLLVGGCAFLVFKNIQLNKSYEAAITQVTQLQSKLDAVGTFADVYTVKTSVKMGQEIKEADLVLKTDPTSSIPANAITDKESLIGNYYRIGFEPGTTITDDLITREEYQGSVYERDVFMDALPVGTMIGDYIDIRVVLPGGEEFVAFEHRRVNARYENAIKLRFDEADLWLYTSMMVDRSIYKNVGFKIYATKYVDPGAHTLTASYFPVRKEVVDIMNISTNLTPQQRSRMWNQNLRASIDAKLKFYADPLNTDSQLIASGNNEESNRYNQADQYYQNMLAEIAQGRTNSGNELQNPNSTTTTTDESLGDLSNGSTSTPPAPTVDGTTDANGNGSVIASQDYLDNLGDNLFDDETPIT